ncbi:MAG: hypothetical protein ACFFDI_00585 [Promethearchaeota archaeon]
MIFPSGTIKDGEQVAGHLVTIVRKRIFPTVAIRVIQPILNG